ncbi:MAG: hypothetical protein KZQ91_13110 [Candidatus Thiodiazotropha sp. (ex Lucinoma borealis)]|nr:hypothetical protein [Candidatus Thiodiazotropha sp. (ex Lucinoma borealis)]
MKLDRYIYPIDKDSIEAFEPFGGVLDLRTPEEGGRNLDREMSDALKRTRLLFLKPIHIFSEAIASYNKHSKLLEQYNNTLEFGYIRNKTPNAFCWKTDKKTYIGVTSGLVHYLFGSFSHLLSFPAFLNNHIDASKETDGDYEQLRDALSTEILFNWPFLSDKVEALHRYPIGIERSAAALELTHMAILFCFFHELSHYYYGHLDFLDTKYNCRNINEVKNMNGDDIAKENLSKRFEIFADDLAMDQLVNNIINGDIYEQTLERYYLLSTSINFLLWLFGQHQLPKPTQKGTHPHPAIRILAMFIKQKNYNSFGMKNSDDNSQIPDDFSVGSTMSLATIDLSKAWHGLDLGGKDCFSFFVDSSSSTLSESHLNEVRVNDSALWNEYEMTAKLSLINTVKNLKSDT